MSHTGKPDSTNDVATRVITTIIVVVFISFGGWSAVRNHLRGFSHEKLTKVYYQGEWTLGEYRDCHSLNLREEDKEPELYRGGSSLMDAGRVFNVSFSGGLAYDGEKPEGAVQFWLCRRDGADPSFSFRLRRSSSSESVNWRSADFSVWSLLVGVCDLLVGFFLAPQECEQRFYDKKIYEVNGMSIGEACKQYPARLP